MMNTRMYQPEHLCDVTTVQQTAVGANLADMVASADDLRLIEQLRSGNEEAFVLLIDRYHTAMLRLAMVYVTARQWPRRWSRRPGWGSFRAWIGSRGGPP